MATRIFVGSLAWATNDDSLKNHFSQVGTVTSANVITDRMSGRSKGFGFVEMSTEEEAQEAIAKLNNSPLDGRNIVVNAAQPRQERAPGAPMGPRRSGGGDRGGFSGGQRRGGNRWN